MNSDPPLVGTACGHAGCNTCDFLPTKCPGCARLFCSVHYFPEVHSCPLFEPSIPVARPETALPCGLEGCSAPCLESYVAQTVSQEGRMAAACPRCSLSFCPEHRFPDTHQCGGPVGNTATRNETARAILAKNFPSHITEKTHVVKRPPELNVKSRRKSKGSELVQKMKMRQAAVPGDPAAGHVDVQDRIHIKVRVDDSTEYKIFWFRKSTITGRALDLLQRHLELSPDKTWALLDDSDDATNASTALTTFDRPLPEVLTDGCRLTLMDS